MSRVHHLELQCEIDSRRESIHGEMSDRQGRKLPFSGWTEFAGVLMELARDEGETTDSNERCEHRDEAAEEIFEEPRKSRAARPLTP